MSTLVQIELPAAGSVILNHRASMECTVSAEQLDAVLAGNIGRGQEFLRGYCIANLVVIQGKRLCL